MTDRIAPTTATTPAPSETDDLTPEERETAYALDALCRTIEAAKAAIAARDAAQEAA